MDAIANLENAMKRAMANRPEVGGFPYLAETLRQAGVARNIWTLPACQSLYYTTNGTVVIQDKPLITGTGGVPAFDRDGLIRALRKDQAGDSTFREFLLSAWLSGVVSYDVDFNKRTVTYYGAELEEYVESYPPVNL